MDQVDWTLAKLGVKISLIISISEINSFIPKRSCNSTGQILSCRGQALDREFQSSCLSLLRRHSNAALLAFPRILDLFLPFLFILPSLVATSSSSSFWLLVVCTIDEFPMDFFRLPPSLTLTLIHQWIDEFIHRSSSEPRSYDLVIAITSSHP